MKKLLLSFVAAFAVQLGISSAFAGDANDTTLINVDFNNITLTGDSVDYDPLWGDAQGGSTVELGLQHWGIWVKDETASFFGWQNYDLGENETLETWGTVYRKTESDNYLKIESDTEVWRRLGKDSSNKASLHDFGAVTIKMKTQFSAAASDATGELDPQDKISVWVKEVLVENTTDQYENKLIVSAADDNGNAKDYVIDTSVDLTNLSTWYALEIKPVAGNKFEVYIGEGEGRVQLSSNGTTQFPSYSNTDLEVNGDENSLLDNKISVVGFKGTGSIDDLVFEKQVAQSFTLNWEEGLSKITYTVGETSNPVEITDSNVLATGTATIPLNGANTITVSYEFAADSSYVLDEIESNDVTIEGNNITIKAGAANPWYTIKTKKTNFFVGGISYEKFADAVGALSNVGTDGTIKLGADVEVVDIEIAQDMILDLNGHTLTGSGEYGTINVNSGVELTIVDSCSEGEMGAVENITSRVSLMLWSDGGSSGSAIIYAGKFVNDICGFNGEDYSTCRVNFFGGWFKTINGGSSIPDSVVIEEGYEVVLDKEDQYFKVVAVEDESTYVAQIGEGEDAQKFETLDVAIEEAQDGDTVKLLNDVTLAKKITVKKAVTLDLNGWTLSETVTDSYGAIYIGTAGNFTITDSATGGKIATDGGIVIGNYGTVTVEGGTIEAGETAEDDTSVYNFYYNSSTYGKLTVNGGKVGRIWNCGNADITAGEVVDIDNSGAMTIADAATVSGTVIIKDGSDAAEVPDAGTLAAPESLTVQVGTEGAEAFYVDGKWLAQVPVATVGEAKYASLDAAIAAAGATDTITLVNDVELTTYVTIAKSLTLDLKGKSISRNEGTALYVNGSVEVTIKGEGSVSAEHVVYVGAGTVTIESGNFHSYNDGHAVYVQGTGNVVIKGGTFSMDKGEYGYVLNEYDQTRDDTSIVVEGGTFVGFNPANNGAEGPNTDFCKEGYLARQTGDNYTVEKGMKITYVSAQGDAPAEKYVLSGSALTAEDLPVLDADGYIFTGWTKSEGNVIEQDTEIVANWVVAVAQIGTTKYPTLQAAVDAAAGATITVIADIVTDGPVTVDEEMEINLGGKTISATNDKSGDGVFHVVGGGNLTISGNGTVNAFGPNDYCMAVWADGGMVTINGGTFTNEGAYSEEDGAHFDLIYVKNGGSVVINGGTFTCETPRWTLNIKNGENQGTITVNGGKFFNFNPADCDTDDFDSYCAEGFLGRLGEDGYYTVEHGKKITYASAQGEVPAAKYVLSGYELTADDLPELTATGYVFGGWDKTAGTSVTADMTITATWTEVPTEDEHDIIIKNDVNVEGLTDDQKAEVKEQIVALDEAVGGHEKVAAYFTAVYGDAKVAAAEVLKTTPELFKISENFSLPLLANEPTVKVAPAESTTGAPAFEFTLMDGEDPVAVIESVKTKQLVKYVQKLGDTFSYNEDELAITFNNGKIKVDFKKTGKSSGFMMVDFTVPAK